MNRLEMVSLFTAMKHLAEKDDKEALLDVIETVLKEAGVNSEAKPKKKQAKK